MKSVFINLEGSAKKYWALFFVSILFFGSLVFAYTAKDYFSTIKVVTYEANSCKGEIVIGEVQGGTAPYTFQWFKQDAVVPTKYNLLTGLIFQILNTQDTGPGIYKVRITDAVGVFIEPEYPISEPYELQASIEFAGLVCPEDPQSGVAIIWFTNGLKPYKCTLENSSNTAVNSGTIDNIFLTITDLSTGTYTLYWEVKFGCTGQKKFDITVPEPILPSLEISDVSCPGGDDGLLKVSLTGGWGPDYAIKLVSVINGSEQIIKNWTNIGTAVQYQVTDLRAGEYRIYYYDKIKNSPFSSPYGFDVTKFYPVCARFESFVIEEPAPFSVLSNQS